MDAQSMHTLAQKTDLTWSDVKKIDWSLQGLTSDLKEEFDVRMVAGKVRDFREFYLLENREYQRKLETWLTHYSAAQSHPHTMYQVFDNSDVMDEDAVDSKESGPRHASESDAIKWGESQGLTAWTVYAMYRCMTRDGKVWYRQGSSYLHDYS